MYKYKNELKIMFPRVQILNFIFSDTRVVFGGSPPVWVYSQMSKPMFKLRGLSGYTDMHRLSLEAATEYNRLYGSEVTGVCVCVYLEYTYLTVTYICTHVLTI